MREHFDRFAHSLAAVRIQGVDLPRLQRRMLDTVAAGKFQEAIAYLQITRGVAPRQHAFPVGITPLEFLYVQEFRDPYQEAGATGPPSSPSPTCAGSAATSNRRTCSATSWPSRPPKRPAASRRCSPARRHPDRRDAHQLFRRARRRGANDAQRQRHPARHHARPGAASRQTGRHRGASRR